MVSTNETDRCVRRSSRVLSGSSGYTSYRVSISVSSSTEQRSQMMVMRSFAVSTRLFCSFGARLKSLRQSKLAWHYPPTFVACSPVCGVVAKCAGWGGTYAVVDDRDMVASTLGNAWGIGLVGDGD